MNLAVGATHLASLTYLIDNGDGSGLTPSTFTPAVSPNQPVWTTSSGSIATVVATDMTGLTATITAIAAGTCTITCTFSSGDKLAPAALSVTVTATIKIAKIV